MLKMKDLTRSAMNWRMPAMMLFMSIFAVSCARHTETEEPSRPVQETAAAVPDSIVFTAVLDQSVRSEIGVNNSVVWSAGDKIKVFNAATPQGLEFELTAGAGTAAGTFGAPGTGMGDGPFYAVYPAGAATTLDGTSVGITLPAEQVYADASFGPGANLSAGKADELSEIRFRNLLGTISFTLTGDREITAIRLHAKGTTPLHGAGTIDGWDEDAPSVTFAAGQTDDSFQQLTLSCSAPVALTTEGKTFHLTVPVGTLAEGFSFEADDAEGGAMIKYAGAREQNRMERSALLQMPALPYAPVYKAGFLLAEEVGAYENILASSSAALRPCCLYTEGESQYAYLNTSSTRYLRIEDWEDGYALAVTMPYTLVEGQPAEDVLVKAAGNTGSVVSGENLTMEVLKVSDGRVWMADAASGKGYVLLIVED